MPLEPLPRSRGDGEALIEALAGARRGWYVVELHGVDNGICACGRRDCGRPGKHPRRRGWPRLATLDPDAIQAMLEDGPTNVGFLTGRRSGIVVLDVDERHGGGDALVELARKHGPMPDTPIALTGGGQHLFFKTSEDGARVPCSDGRVGPGLDVRGDGGYVVGAGSVHASGRRYVWEISSHPNDVPLAELPGWLLTLMRGRTGRQQQGADGSPPRWTPNPHLAVLNGVPEGRRHDSIFVMSSSLRGRRVPAPVIEDLALHAAANCRPPLSPDEAAAVAADVVTRFGPGGGLRRRPTEDRLAIMACVAASAGPVKPARVAEILGQPRERVKKTMARMATTYGELVATPLGYLLATGRRPANLWLMPEGRIPSDGDSCIDGPGTVEPGTVPTESDRPGKIGPRPVRLRGHLTSGGGLQGA